MKLGEIISVIEKKYPEFLQYDFDNSGLNMGDKDAEVKKILLSLEATESVVDEAIEKGVDLIITHHPFLFSGVKNIVMDDVKGRCIIKLLRSNISIYCMHTSFDIAFDGLNDYFLKISGIKNEGVFEKLGVDRDYCEAKPYGMGRLGRISPETAGKFISSLKDVLKVDNVRFVGNLDKKIETIAVVTGNGSEYFEKAYKHGVDLLITGDLKYHQGIDSFDLGICVADFGHFGTENIFKDAIYPYLDENLTDIEIIKSEINIDPFKNI